MRNIIDTSNKHEHCVESYKFKVLGGSQVVQEEKTEEYVQKDTTPIFKEEEQAAQKEVTQNKEQENNKFIEELLKKTDELSSSMIKMQMQMEKQESEFENRLKLEIERESKIAYQNGFDKAKSELEANINSIKSKYVTSIDNLEKEVEKSNTYFKKIEDDLSTTALEIAKEVIKKEINESSQKVALALSHELINDLKGGKKIEIKVNPKDFDAIKEAYKDKEHIFISADDAITEGGVIVLSDVGNLDGNIATRIQKVKNLISYN